MTTVPSETHCDRRGLAADFPRRYLAKSSKAARKGRIYVDYLRNDPSSTAVAPYSTRAREGAPVELRVDMGKAHVFDPSTGTNLTHPESR